MAELTPVADVLLARRNAFKAFLARRLGNPADAEDVLQHSLLRALERADEIRDRERAVAWFYRLLRHAAVDHIRSRRAAGQREERWAAESAVLADDREAEREICGCFESLLPTLKPLHAELLRRVELQDEPVAAAAAALGLSPNLASVTLHRARAALREKLAAMCGPCSDRACLDCDCA